MISTYKALFQGRRELFKGLAIEKTDWDWDKEVYPVLHLDMSNAAASNVREFESRLEMMLRHQFTIFDFVYNDKVSPSANFIALLDNLPGKSANGKYVLLIDEYDAPIAGMLDSDDGRRKELAALLKTAFAKVPHEWLVKDERIMKQQFLSFMVFARAEIVGEEQHSLGRPDAVLKTEKAIYIIEFKYGASSAAALAQCRDRHYADAYTADPRRIVYVGANYNPKERTFDNVATGVVKE